MDLQQEIDKRKKENLFRQRQVIDSAQGPVVNIKDHEFINFTSNDYLGFANNEDLKACMVDSINQYGIGAGSSQLLAGHLAPHHQLENKLAEFLNRDAALVFPTGYQTNLAIASALIDSKTIVLQDRLNHASLIDSALLSKGRLVRYRHKDVDQLKKILEKNKKQKLLIMTDGVFSMDGDAAPLIEIADLCKTYSATLVVDDAHGIGVLGKKGGGLLEKLNLGPDQVPLLVGTFGKSFGASGAFVAGSRLHVEMFIQKARTYIYTTALMPAVAATMIKAIDMVINGKSLRKNINDLIVHYQKKMKEAGIKTKVPYSHIQPLIIGEASKAISVSKKLQEKKILVSAIRPPTVPKGTSRLRISITATHTTEQIDSLVRELKAFV